MNAPSLHIDEASVAEGLRRMALRDLVLVAGDPSHAEQPDALQRLFDMREQSQQVTEDAA